MATIIGTDGNDNLTGSAADDDIFGLAGADTLRGEAGDDLLDGGSGNDTLKGGSGDDVLRGGAGSDALQGGSGFDTADYATLGQAITLLSEGRVAEAGGGEDVLTDMERIVGDAGQINTIDGENSGNSRFTVDLSQNSLFIDIDNPFVPDPTFTVENFSNVIGTAQNDWIAGNAANNNLKGADGDDTLVGSTGNDVIEGDRGHTAPGRDFDTVDYSGLNQAIRLLPVGVIEKGVGGSAGTDEIFGIERIVGDAGEFNTIDGANSTGSRFEVDLGQGVLTVIPLSGAGPFEFDVENFTNVIGTANADTIIGNAADNVIRGGAGNDTMRGGAGDDRIYWGSGDRFRDDDNRIVDVGGSGYDTLVVEAGSTFVTFGLDYYGFEAFEGAAGNDQAIGNLDTVNYNLSGGAGDDTLIGAGGDDVIRGGAGNDTMRGGAGDDRIYWGSGDRFRDDDNRIVDVGGSGYDTLVVEAGSTFVTFGLDYYGFEAFEGAAGNDQAIGNLDTVNYNLSGGAGDDTLIGAGGDDVIRGGAGRDTMRGGAGDDRIYWGSGDRFRDDDNRIVDVGGSGYDTLVVEAGSTFVTFGLDYYGFEAFEGAAGNDQAIGNLDTVNYNLSGGAGDDTLIGAGGDDVIRGGAGNDTLTGGAGEDTGISPSIPST
jgi:Ca2+-binding RTX toxin-like protein